MALTLIRGASAVGAVILLGVGSATLVGRIRNQDGLTIEPNEVEITLDTDDPRGLWVEGEGDAKLRLTGHAWGVDD